MTPSSLKSIIEKAGARYLGVRGLGEYERAYFNDPVTKSTLALPPAQVTVAAVKKKLEESRKAFKSKEK